MGLVFKRIIIFIYICLVCTSCSREIENPATVKINFQQLNSAKSQSIQPQAYTPNWNTGINPVIFSEIDCYGVFIGGPEPSLSLNSCEKTGGSEYFEFGPSILFVPSTSSDISLSVPSGNNRTITIVGLNTNAGACRLYLPPDDEPDFTNLSAPHIIAQKTLNLPPGDVVVELNAALDTSRYIDDCSFIEGSANPFAEISFSDTGIYDFGTIATGGYTSAIFTVTNEGLSTASSISGSGLAAPFSFVGGTYPGSGGDCTASLAPGASCNIEVSFSPATLGLQSDSIELSYFNGDSIVVSAKQVDGNGDTPASLSITEADPYDYGTITSGSSTSHMFTITNSGGVAATAITEIGLVAPFEFLGGTYPGTGGTCAPSLNPGASCDIVVEFAPVGSGLFTDTIDLTYNNGAGVSSVTRDVQGTGELRAVISISETDPYDFGSTPTGTPIDHTFTLTNNGSANATGIGEVGLAAPFSFKGGSYPGTGGTCGTNLNVAASCTIVIRFDPVSLGVQVDTIDIQYNDGVGVTNSTRSIQGSGI